MKPVVGILHGKTIELTDFLGLPDGSEIEITVREFRPAKFTGEGLRLCAGALAEEWTAEDDRILEQIQQERENTSFRDLPE